MVMQIPKEKMNACDEFKYVFAFIERYFSFHCLSARLKLSNWPNETFIWLPLGEKRVNLKNIEQRRYSISILKEITA